MTAAWILAQKRRAQRSARQQRIARRGPRVVRPLIFVGSPKNREARAETAPITRRGRVGHFVGRLRARADVP